MADARMLGPGHADHDRELIASTVDRGKSPPSLARVLLAACTECARLHTDLLDLAVALPSAATPRRTRDFTLSGADADRLRPRGLTRWLRLIGSSRDTLTRPLAIGFTTLGLAGLLVATVPGALPGAGDTPRQMQSAMPQMEVEVASEPGDVAARLPYAEGIPPVIVLSSVFVVTGGGLFAARWMVPGRARPRGSVR